MADTATVRQWAREQGFRVGDRGRLSPDVVAAFEAAHGAGGGSGSGASRGRSGRTPARTPAKRSAARSTPARAGSPAAERRGSAGGRTVHARTPWDWPRREG